MRPATGYYVFGYSAYDRKLSKSWGPYADKARAQRQMELLREVGELHGVGEVELVFQNSGGKLTLVAG